MFLQSNKAEAVKEYDALLNGTASPAVNLEMKKNPSSGAFSLKNNFEKKYSETHALPGNGIKPVIIWW